MAFAVAAAAERPWVYWRMARLRGSSLATTCRYFDRSFSDLLLGESQNQSLSDVPQARGGSKVPRCKAPPTRGS